MRVMVILTKHGLHRRTWTRTCPPEDIDDAVEGICETLGLPTKIKRDILIGGPGRRSWGYSWRVVA